MELTGFSFEGETGVLIGLLLGGKLSRGVLITSNDDVSLEIEFLVLSSNLESVRSLSLSSKTSISASELSETSIENEEKGNKIT